MSDDESDYDDDGSNDDEGSNEEEGDYGEMEEDELREEKLFNELKADLTRKFDNKAKTEQFGAPPAGFDFSVLQEREENGLRLGTFLKPRVSRTHFGIGFQDLGWNFYDNEVQSTPSRLIKFVFKKAEHIPQPNGYEVHSHVLRYALFDSSVLGTSAGRERAVVSPVFTIISPITDRKDVWEFPHYKDLFHSNNPANLRIQQQSNVLKLYVELGVNVVRTGSVATSSSSSTTSYTSTGDPAVANKAIHCLSSGWCLIDLDDSWPWYKEDSGAPAPPGAVPSTSAMAGSGDPASAGVTGAGSSSATPSSSSAAGTSGMSTGASRGSMVKTISLPVYTPRPMPSKSKALPDKIYAGEMKITLNGGSVFNKQPLVGDTGKEKIREDSKVKPTLTVLVKDPRAATKKRNECFPATILYPRQFQPALLTYRRLLARRLCKIDEPKNALLSSPTEPLTFKADSEDYIFKIFPTIADSTLVMAVFTRRWTQIYKKDMTDDERKNWDSIATKFKELTTQIWPLVHLYSAQLPLVPPIVPALPSICPHTAYPMTEKTANALFDALLDCATIPPADFLCGRIPAGTVLSSVKAAASSSSSSSAPAATSGQAESHVLFKPFRASELRLNFAEGFLPS